MRAFAHITSDGLLNLTRVKSDVGYVIDAPPAAPPIFSIIQRLGGIDDAEMHAVFNMGIGFCAVVPAAEADKAVSILSSRGKRAQKIGYAVTDAARTVRIPAKKLIGRGKHFVAE